MIRVALAVACAVALLGASLPAIDDARTENAAATIETDLNRLDRAAAAVAAADRPRTDTPGERRAVVISLPDRTVQNAGVEAVRIGGASNRTVEYHPGGGRTQTAVLSAPVRPEGGGQIVLSSPGTHRLVLSPAADGDGVLVAVDSPD